MTQVYIDCYGGEHVPDAGDVVEKRTGLHAVILAKGMILLAYPKHAPDLAELPGGGLETGEDYAQALQREIEEEAAVKIDISHLDPSKHYQMLMHYYSEKRGVMWDYDQTFWLLDGPEMDQYFFAGEAKPEDAASARWVALSELKDLKIHAIHARALKYFGLL